MTARAEEAVHDVPRHANALASHDDPPTLTSLGEDLVERIVIHLEKNNGDARALFHASREFGRSPAIRQAALTAALRNNARWKTIIGHSTTEDSAECIARMEGLLATSRFLERSRRLCAFVTWANARGGLHAFDAAVFAMHSAEPLESTFERLVVAEHCAKGMLSVPERFRSRLFHLVLDAYEQALDDGTRMTAPLRLYVAHQAYRVLKQLTDGVEHLPKSERGAAAAAALELTNRLPLDRCFDVWITALEKSSTLPMAAATLIAKTSLELPHAESHEERLSEGRFLAALLTAVPHIDEALIPDLFDALLTRTQGDDDFELDGRLAASFNRAIVSSHPATRALMVEQLSGMLAEMTERRSEKFSSEIGRGFARVPIDARHAIFPRIAPYISLPAGYEDLPEPRTFRLLVDPHDPTSIHEAINEYMLHSIGQSPADNSGPFATYFIG